jgi:hypothetical protein
VWRQGTSLVEVVDSLEWRAVLEGVVALGETRALWPRPVMQGWAILQAKVALARVFRLRALLEGWLLLQANKALNLVVVGSRPTVGAKCWNLLSAAKRPTRVNSGDNRVTCSGAIALLI